MTEQIQKLIIGSRESLLAVRQSEIVMEYMHREHPEIRTELRTMKTTGDRILSRRLDEIGGKGLFVKELDQALRDERTDLSVHCLKDMPMEIPEDLPVIGYSVREDPRDVLVLPEGAEAPDLTKPIGTSSRRRILQAQNLFPQARFESVRGNVQTRLRKLDEGEYGALILAAAGLRRLGLDHRISRFFSTEEIIPSAGQGVLVLQGRSGRDYSFLRGFLSRESALTSAAERAFVRALGGGCTSPIAAFASFEKNLSENEKDLPSAGGSAQVCRGAKMTLRGFYYDDIRGRGFHRALTALVSTEEEARQAGERLARTILAEAEGSADTGAGKVWLVGAGPGDRGLFTLKGLEVLNQADVVVYDALVGDEVLTLIPPHAEKINAGKRASRHLMNQDLINRTLLEQAQAGRKVVRLKGGDPFVFGRGGEELELLAQNNIPFEVVPGVTSAFAVPAYNGIPVTHRDFASSVHIITGHRRHDAAGQTGAAGKADTAQNSGASQNSDAAQSAGAARSAGAAKSIGAANRGEASGIDYEALVRMGGTLVFLMGLSSLGAIMDGLLAAGMDPQMPAALLEKGTTARQRRVCATVATLCGEAARARIQAPAIIVVGEVCRLADTFAWAEKRPLAGKKILVTRPREQASKTAARLRKLGAEVLEIPAIETLPLSPDPALDACLQGFQSAHRFQPDPESGGDPSAVDPAIAEEPSGTTFPASGMPAASEAGFPARPDWNISVHAHSASCAGVPARPDWIVFTSPTGVRVFMQAFLKKSDVRSLWGTRIAAIGKGSAAELAHYGLRADFVPSVYDGETLGRELAAFIRRERENDGDRTHCTLPENSPAQKNSPGAGTTGGNEKAAEPVRILIPRAAAGNPELVRELQKAGSVEIQDIPTYETKYAASPIVDERQRIADGDIDYAVFTSASTVRGFAAAVEGLDLSRVKAVCIGRQTRAAALEYGMQTRMAESATIDALVDTVVSCARAGW